MDCYDECIMYGYDTTNVQAMAFNGAYVSLCGKVNVSYSWIWKALYIDRFVYVSFKRNSSS